MRENPISISVAGIIEWIELVHDSGEFREKRV
jgi:hypothetical protein